MYYTIPERNDTIIYVICIMSVTCSVICIIFLFVKPIIESLNIYTHILIF